MKQYFVCYGEVFCNGLESAIKEYPKRGDIIEYGLNVWEVVSVKEDTPGFVDVEVIPFYSLN